MSTVLQRPQQNINRKSAESELGYSTEKRRTRTFNVLKIAPTSFFADYGCHVRILEEIYALQNLGNKVTVVTYHTGNEVGGIDIRRAMNTPGRKTVQVGSNIHKIYYDALLLVKSFQVALKVRPDVIHAHLHEGALIGYPLSRLLRVPLVFDFQGSLTSEMLDHKFIRRESAFFPFLRQLEQIINRMATVIVTSSHNAAEVLTNEFKVSRERVFTLADSVNTDDFRPRWEIEDLSAVDRLRNELGIPTDRKVVVYLGLLAEYQGIGKLLEAASILVEKGQPVHFLIMGFPGEDTYRTIAAQMGLASYTTFTGRVPYQNAPKYLLLGDVAVSPKISETEGNGKLLNYMSVGLPTVTFDTPVANEILGDLGVYAETGSSQSLAAALEFLLTNQGVAEKRARNLRNLALSRYSWAEAGRMLPEIYSLACD